MDIDEQSLTIEHALTFYEMQGYKNNSISSGYAHFIIPFASHDVHADLRNWFRNDFKPLLVQLMRSKAIRYLRIESKVLSPQILELLAHWIWLNQPQLKDFHIVGFSPYHYYQVYRYLSQRAEYINFYEKAMQSTYLALIKNKYIENITHYYQFVRDYELDPEDGGAEFAPQMRGLPTKRRPNKFQWNSFEDVNDEHYHLPHREECDFVEDDESIHDYHGLYTIEYNPDDNRYQSRYNDLGVILHDHPTLQRITLYSHPDNDDIGQLKLFDTLIRKKNLHYLRVSNATQSDIDYIENLIHTKRSRVRGAVQLTIDYCYFFQGANDIRTVVY
jgi:hypothetical protein